MNKLEFKGTTAAFNLAAVLRKHKVTIRELKARTGLTLKTIRAIRGREYVEYTTYCDLTEAITGQNVFNRATYDNLYPPRPFV